MPRTLLYANASLCLHKTLRRRNPERHHGYPKDRPVLPAQMRKKQFFSIATNHAIHPDVEASTANSYPLRPGSRKTPPHPGPNQTYQSSPTNPISSLALRPFLVPVAQSHPLPHPYHPKTNGATRPPDTRAMYPESQTQRCIRAQYQVLVHRPHHSNESHIRARRRDIVNVPYHLHTSTLTPRRHRF